MRPPRLVHLTWRLSVSGGIPRFARDLLARLHPASFEVHSVTVRPLWPEDRLDELGPRIAHHSLGVEGRPGPFAKVAMLLRFRRLLARLRPDVLHTHDGTAWLGLAALLLRPPVPVRVLQIHDPPQARRVSRWATAIQRWMVRRLDFRPVVDTEPIREQLAVAFRLDPSAIRVVPLGVDVTALESSPVSPADWRAARGLPVEPPIVLYVARLVESKNVELFVEVAKELLSEGVDALFVVAGDGPLRPRLERSLAGFPQRRRIPFLGFVDDLVSAYHACDLFLSTSHAEGFGLAVAEAMAAGQPVVATAVGGVRWLVDEESGVLCPPGDGPALAAAVRSLLGDPARRQRMGAAARRRAVSHFGLDAMSRRYEALFRDLLAERAPEEP